MLEPDLKSGAGGLRDVQAPGWAGWSAARRPRPVTDRSTVGRGTAASRASSRSGYLQPDDPERLRDARAPLLDARVALHRVTGGRSDRLPLQDQDAVAGWWARADADELVRALGEAARAVVWITRDLWSRLLATEAGPTRSAERQPRPRRRHRAA